MRGETGIAVGCEEAGRAWWRSTDELPKLKHLPIFSPYSWFLSLCICLFQLFPLSAQSSYVVVWLKLQFIPLNLDWIFPLKYCEYSLTCWVEVSLLIWETVLFLNHPPQMTFLLLLLSHDFDGCMLWFLCFLQENSLLITLLKKFSVVFLFINQLCLSYYCFFP